MEVTFIAKVNYIGFVDEKFKSIVIGLFF